MGISRSDRIRSSKWVPQPSQVNSYKGISCPFPGKGSACKEYQADASFLLTIRASWDFLRAAFRQWMTFRLAAESISEIVERNRDWVSSGSSARMTFLVIV